MARPSRTRRILKWTSIALSLLILAIWMISLRFYAAALISENEARVWLESQPNHFCISSDSLGRSRRATPGVSDSGTWASLGLEMPRIIQWPPVMNYEVLVPYWLPLLLTAIPTAWLWHRDRRLFSCSPDHLLCSRCGYDLTGNTSGVCSECGLAKPPRTIV